MLSHRQIANELWFWYCRLLDHQVGRHTQYGLNDISAGILELYAKVQKQNADIVSGGMNE